MANFSPLQDVAEDSVAASIVEELSVAWAGREVPHEIGVLFRAALRHGVEAEHPDVLKILLISAYELGRKDRTTH